jgi:cytoskeleton protein RodZ
MRSVGEILQQARLAQKLELADVATRLKIKPKYLTAIEENDLSELPGVFFYRSFVQQYARALDIDSASIDAELDRVTGSAPPPPLPGQDGLPVAVRKPSYESASRFRPRSWTWSIAGLALMVTGCTGVLMVWNNRAEVGARAVAIITELTQKPIQPPAPVQKPIAAPALPGVPVVVPASTNAAASQPADHVVLRLTAIEPTWVSVVADGKTVYSGVLQPSESRSIDGKTAKLTTGNAGGLSVEFNGKSIGAVGDRGQVRVVMFSPDRFEFSGGQQAAVVPTPRAL